MNTMSKCNIGGHDFYYERVPLCGGKGVAVFAVKDEADAKKFDTYWVVIPVEQDWEKGCSTPKDGHVVCMCRGIIDAKIVASAIDIAQDLASRAKGLDKSIEDKLENLEDEYDIEAMSKEMRRLRDEGKSRAEILDIMSNKHETFLRKKPDETKKDGGEW